MACFKKCLIFFCLILFLAIVSSCEDNNAVLAYVNGEAIYQADIDAAIERYLPNELTYSDALDSAICELVVLQQSDVLGVRVHDNEIENLIKELEEYSPELYNIAVREYKTLDEYKKSLLYLVTYNKIMDAVTDKYISENPLIDSEIPALMVEYGFIENTDVLIEDNLKELFINEYNEYRREKYFGEWIESLRQSSDIVYTEAAEDLLYKK